MADIHARIVALRQEGRTAVLVTVVDSSGHVPLPPPGKMLVDADGLLAGTVGGGRLEALAVDEARRVLAAGGTLLKEYVLAGDTDAPGDAQATGMVCGGRATLFFEVLAPPRRVYVFGAGHVGQALARVLTASGFQPVLIDDRPGLAPDLTAAPGYTQWPPLTALADSCVVVATAGHDGDRTVLRQILGGDRRPRYLGLLASTRKWRTVAADLRAELGVDLDLDWIHSPAGLRLGGRTPAAIALSIAAEIQAVLSGEGRHDHLGVAPEREAAP